MPDITPLTVPAILEKYREYPATTVDLKPAEAATQCIYVLFTN